MDLIYADATKKDIGVLHDFKFDLAYGSDENDFALEITQNNHCCEQGYFVYIEGTEYGGVIDKIAVDTTKKIITYGGRTWHGILASTIIEPEVGNDYFYVDGDANEVLAELLERFGMTDLFGVSEEASGIEVLQYQFRYCDLYEGMCEMLSEFGGKLRMKHNGEKVILSAVYKADFSTDEEWDASQVDFKVEKKFRPTNHLVCLGGGELKERKVIHLFTDENGNVQQYTHTDDPKSDADYVLDKSKQVMTGIDEVSEVYDYPSATAVKNYVAMQAQPSDWATNYAAYYAMGENGFGLLEGVNVDVYTLQRAVPSDWAKKYSDYYQKDGDNESYEPVEAVDETLYILQTAQPSDWAKNYPEYYQKATNDDEYEAVPGEPTYALQTAQPSDWATNYADYYFIHTDEADDQYEETVQTYESVSSDTKYEYSLLTEQPYEWENTYGNYFTKSGSEYNPVEDAEIPYYVKVKKKPKDWDDTYDDYFFRKKGATSTPEEVQTIAEDVYTLQTKEPEDWEEGYRSYYYKKANGKYKKIPSYSKYTYMVYLSEPPLPWEMVYRNFYVRMGSKFVSVATLEKKQAYYALQFQKPSDWSKKYGNYYFYYSDGVTKGYKRVQGISKYKYSVQTSKPTDWDDKYANYYQLDKDGKGYVAVTGKKYTTPSGKEKETAPTWKKKKYYTKESYQKAPKWEPEMYYTFVDQIVPQFIPGVYWEKIKVTVPPWEKKKYYTKTTKNIPDWSTSKYEYFEQKINKVPVWKANTFYKEKTSEIAPTWKANTYYTRTVDVAPDWTANTYYTQKNNTIPHWKANTFYTHTSKVVAPTWEAFKYYELKYDNYAQLVEGGIKRLKKSYDCDSIKINLSDEYVYDIGDIVGASEHITGISVWQPITKKIVTIENNSEKISYEIGQTKE